MTEKLDILVVEDNPKHQADAREEIERRIRGGLPISVDILSDYLDARKAMSEKKYHGIISDIFFPWSTQSTTEKSRVIPGWNESGRMKCYTLLKEHGINYPEELSQNREMRDRQIRIVEEADKWMDGLAMHPTGVIMVEDAQRQGIPIVLCTDTYHHGYASQPIHTYAMEQGVKIIDSYNQMEGSAPSKDWPRAFDTLLKIIRPSQIEENPSSRKSRYA